MKPELVLDCQANIGESLLWVDQEERLYFADIKAPALHALRPATGEIRTWPLPSDIGGFALDGSGNALVALRHGLHWLSLEKSELNLITPSPFNPRLIRFNESACDSRGRFWIGSMTDPLDGSQTMRTGALHSFTTAEGLRPHPDFAHITNGMAWNEDESLFYLSHSEDHAIYQYDYDNEQGQLGTRRLFATITSHGVPDGSAVDTEGGYWCAIHGVGRLHRYSRDGDLTAIVTLPVSQPTMCCFAGPGLDHLYISSARNGLDTAALHQEPLAGALFRIKAPFPGLKRHWRVT